MVEIKMSEDEDYTELFEKIIGVYGEFRLSVIHIIGNVCLIIVIG